MIKKYIIIIFLLAIPFLAKTQDTAIFTKFYYENGVISSEGIIRDGKPDRYWKTFNEKGILISEGNRRDFELDSVWKFYSENGKLTMEVFYQNGKKNGIRKSYLEKEFIEENYKDDIKQGLTIYFYPKGNIMRIIPFDNGLEHGISKEFGEDSTIIAITEYRRGMVIMHEKFNRRDKNGLKQGLWKTFWDNDKTKIEGTYINDKKNGFFKSFTPEGNLLLIDKYINDEKQIDVPELRSLEVRTDYFPDGKVKIVASYDNGVAEGVRREYKVDGSIEQSYIFKKGVIIGKGIVDENGLKQGLWTEFYDNGAKKSDGKYKDNKKIGDWKFFYKNGNTEQEGMYNNKGNAQGEWKWYFNNGNELLTQNFQDGIEEGLLMEYNDTGKVITKGEFLEGQETGIWYYNINNYVLEGKYIDGKRDGVWKEYYPDGKLKFSGEYIEDNPNGKHYFYWDNGKLKENGNYIMGKRDGEWLKYEYEGNLFLKTYYRNGREIKFDNVTVEPKIEGDE
ncbi:MAG: toxin-antitoxin system YwqK family antitoxin [Bacteroidales bacterium]